MAEIRALHPKINLEVPQMESDKSIPDSILSIILDYSKRSYSDKIDLSNSNNFEIFKQSIKLIDPKLTDENVIEIYQSQFFNRAIEISSNTEHRLNLNDLNELILRIKDQFRDIPIDQLEKLMLETPLNKEKVIIVLRELLNNFRPIINDMSNKKAMKNFLNLIHLIPYKFIQDEFISGIDHNIFYSLEFRPHLEEIGLAIVDERVRSEFFLCMFYAHKPSLEGILKKIKLIPDKIVRSNFIQNCISENIIDLIKNDFEKLNKYIDEIEALEIRSEVLISAFFRMAANRIYDKEKLLYLINKTPLHNVKDEMIAKLGELIRLGRIKEEG